MPLVCRRWRALADSPPLCQDVTLILEGSRVLWRLYSLTLWLAECAAGHLQQLDLQICAGDGEKQEAAAMVAQHLWTLPPAHSCTAAGKLAELTVHLNAPFCVDDRMAAALQSLRRLSIRCDSMLLVSASLLPLASLECLCLHCGIPEAGLVLEAGALLPPSLTKLELSGQGRPDLPPQVLLLWQPLAGAGRARLLPLPRACILQH